MRWRYAFLVVVSLTLIAADQGTKWWAATSLAERRVERARPACDDDGPIARRERYRPIRQIHVIEGYLSLRYVENCAGAFGILSDQDESVRRPFFLAVTFAAIVFIVLLFRRLKPSQKLLTWALPFVLGGALGNLIDRLHLKYVIDFVDMYHASIGRWPTYNVADAAIVIGVGLILLDMIPSRKGEPASTSAKSRDADEPSRARSKGARDSDEEESSTASVSPTESPSEPSRSPTQTTGSPEPAVSSSPSPEAPSKPSAEGDR